MSKRNEYGHLIVAGETSSPDDALTSHQLSTAEYKGGQPLEVLGIKSFAVSMKRALLRVSLNIIAKVDDLNRVTIHEDLVGNMAEFNERTGGHSLEVRRSERGDVTLLFDGSPVNAERVDVRAGAAGFVKLDITGIYLDKIDIDIDGLKSETLQQEK